MRSRAVVWRKMKEDGPLLESASTALKDDHEIVLEAAKQSDSARSGTQKSHGSLELPPPFQFNWFKGSMGQFLDGF